jgi:protein-tyrosine phosphatase
MDGFHKTYTDIIETIEESLEKGQIILVHCKLSLHAFRLP